MSWRSLLAIQGHSQPCIAEVGVRGLPDWHLLILTSVPLCICVYPGLKKALPADNNSSVQP